MKDKFRENIRFALPAAIITALIYGFLGQGQATNLEIGNFNCLLVLPYLCVLILAIIGINVMLVLFVGILMNGVIGMSMGIFCFNEWIMGIVNGMSSLGGIIFVMMMAGGILIIVSEGGGLTWIMKLITKNIHNRKGAEASIICLSAITCMCTANNTIAIVSLGKLAKSISERYGIEPRRSASLVDASTCCIQGLIPYGAHLMFAATTAGISAIALVPYEFYPVIMGVFMTTTIFLRKKKTTSKQDQK